VRRFSPSEVARLLGLPASFRFPDDLSLEARYRLLGNGLSIPVAAWALDHL
jgi:DNA (cytosine-5)-methyltransferase 1/tRNA (cytosine38-C5)-methyltransferase